MTLIGKKSKKENLYICVLIAFLFINDLIGDIIKLIYVEGKEKEQVCFV